MFLLHLYLQVHPVPLPTSLPTAAKDLTVELEPPVDKKALTKAFTPPVTLSNFKPRNVTTKESKQEPHTTTSGAHVVESGCPTSRQEDVEGKDVIIASIASSSKPRDTKMKLPGSFAKAPPPTSRDAPILIEEAPGAPPRPKEKVQSTRLGKRKFEECASIASSSKPRDTKMKLTDSFAKAPPPTSRDAPILIEEAPGAPPRPKEKVQSTRLGKRKFEECVSVASSSKPRDTKMKLTDSFAKALPPTSRDAPILIEEAPGAPPRPKEKVQSTRLGKRKFEECVPIVKALKQRLVVHCPVCSKEFTDVSNFDLNQHLDSCLRAQLALNPPQTMN